MALAFYNSYTLAYEKFEPRHPDRVAIYNCGPTVYNYNHIGNFRSYMFVDLLRRYLKLRGYGLEHSSNITDVDDKIIDTALKQKKSISDFTLPFIQAFLEDSASLKIEPVEHRPKATDSIPAMIDIITELKRRGHTYMNEGNVYFRINSFPRYGELAKLDADNLKTAAGGRFDADEYSKEDARDFALWKAPVSEDEPAWDSPWGKGRPGWHLECSAMIREHYGSEGIDIHIGGVDLLFPHHENEIAQSCCAYPSDNFAKIWMHNEHLLVDGKKMSKSQGNFYTLRDLTDRKRAETLVKENHANDVLLKMIDNGTIHNALRYLLIGTHYRTKLNFTFENLKASEAAIERVNTLILRLIPFCTNAQGNIEEHLNNRFIKLNEHACAGEGCNSLTDANIAGDAAARAMQGFLHAMDDDLNISKALASIFDLVRSINATLDKESLSSDSAESALLVLYAVNRLLDIFQFKANKVPHTNESKETEEYVQSIIALRLKAKSEKNFKESDRLRDELLQKGIRLKDTATGTLWERV